MHACHDGALASGVVAVVAYKEVVGPRRFQPRVTDGDVQRVGVIDHGEEVSHGRLRSGAAVVDVKVRCL